ncbi:conserved hypothetical protein [Uncinocarpus reesii 1704]|uniref:2'-phosphotransferase n=1 Tax=Uncinocarpus reesii (strain UAMH 1704) TaxID=336963 RepID=C4JK46_UNCRE|nr:uncharacterized protein UREG_02003 [Uncinocarpus reesii 1704]EEP77154.1 conserved hypothetical protein [Uncinocarpus reesii 1704]
MAQLGQRAGRREPPSRKVAISKALSYILRHAAEREASSDKQRFGLLYIPSDSRSQPNAASSPDSALQAVEDIASKDAATSENATAQALAASVDDTDPYHYLIRARQGHSIKSVDASSLLRQLSPADSDLPETAVHGTYHTAWPEILESGGLKCMGRNQIHFATGPALSTVLPDGLDGAVVDPPKLKGRADGREDGVISGMRSNSQILIYIDLKKALAAGCPFWMSENGVILSEGMEVEGGHGSKILGTEFFDVVVGLRHGLGVLWANGSLAQKTPDWMLASAKDPHRRGGKKRQGAQMARKSNLPRITVERDRPDSDLRSEADQITMRRH